MLDGFDSILIENLERKEAPEIHINVALAQSKSGEAELSAQN